ncbi:hypothetical protein A2154_03030 [Candidatus Gottesmanbacteria bacterium RBG_16_43_7]|uniref:Uncharacterized protein n=1 Tax=Candidatus Gottesmanbacteria bacterium RBG_16_43_7 TaxID=1798373 RepID=A0A1F5ZBD0_9BACT|nr:MAG: hypothetical protein A2154_03030 [Candidatus Gottesmanbacteria bacterium RBG_16_43_7]
MVNKSKPLISVILPCLNEAATITIAISWIKQGLQKLSRRYRSEIIIVDNGSTDNSAYLARKTGVQVIREPRPGYGQALLAGFTRSRGDIIIMGDSDATYDFREIPKLVQALKSNVDIVLGNRFARAKSRAAIPPLNRIVGNPVLTGLINLFYGAGISDSQSGLRALTRDAYRKMDLRTTGMEFASEMIIKTLSHRLTIKEVPITYYQRRTPSKLSLITDAYRHIQAILLYSPTFLLVIPGLIVFLLGAFLTVMLLPGPLYLGRIMIDIHTMIIAILLAILGMHSMLIGIFTRVYLVRVLGIPGGFLSQYLMKYISTELLLGIGLMLFSLGFLVIVAVTGIWITSGFSALARARELIAASGLTIIGFQLTSSALLFGQLKK